MAVCPLCLSVVLSQLPTWPSVTCPSSSPGEHHRLGLCRVPLPQHWYFWQVTRPHHVSSPRHRRGLGARVLGGGQGQGCGGSTER